MSESLDPALDQDLGESLDPRFLVGGCGLVHLASVSRDTRVLFNVVTFVRICLVREAETLEQAGSNRCDGAAAETRPAIRTLNDYLQDSALILPRVINSSFNQTARGTALHLAAVYGNISALRLLLRWGARVELRTDDGKPKTALQLVAQLGRSIRSAAVRALVRLGGASPESCDYKGWTPLIIASNKGNKDVVFTLCDDFTVNVNYVPGDAGPLGIPERFHM